MLRCYVVVVLPLPNVDNNFASASAWALTILCGINGLYCIDLEFHLRISDKVSLLVLAGHSLDASIRPGHVELYGPVGPGLTLLHPRHRHIVDLHAVNREVVVAPPGPGAVAGVVSSHEAAQGDMPRLLVRQQEGQHSVFLPAVREIVWRYEPLPCLWLGTGPGETLLPCHHQQTTQGRQEHGFVTLSLL